MTGAPDMQPEEVRPFSATPVMRTTISQRIRGYFLTGIIVAGPLAVTVYITTWIIGLID